MLLWGDSILLCSHQSILKNFSWSYEQPQTFHGGEDYCVIFISEITLVTPQACFGFHLEQSAKLLYTV